MMQRIRRSLLTFAVIALVLPQHAVAWNESGHRVIAAAAARQMPPELQLQMARVLRAHPRYEEDLAAFRPRRLKGLSELEWLLGQAAQWPDHARRFDNAPRHKRDSLVVRFHRGNWHYINLPVYLAKSDRALRIKDPTRKLPEVPPRDALSALAYIRTTLQDPCTSDEDRGLLVSWALHLIADVHQPLHTAALFTQDRWPRGDRGGNEVKIAGSGKGAKGGRLDSLHYYWDSAISNRREPYQIGKLIGVLDEQKLPKLARNEAQPVKWVREGRSIANRLVYEPLRAQLALGPVVTINKKYTRKAHAVSLRRAALAARRTALWLDEALSVKALRECKAQE